MRYDQLDPLFARDLRQAVLQLDENVVDWGVAEGLEMSDGLQGLAAVFDLRGTLLVTGGFGFLELLTKLLHLLVCDTGANGRDRDGAGIVHADANAGLRLRRRSGDCMNKSAPAASRLVANATAMIVVDFIWGSFE